MDDVGEDILLVHSSLSSPTVILTRYYSFFITLKSHIKFAYVTFLLMGASCLWMKSNVSLPFTLLFPFPDRPNSLERDYHYIFEFIPLKRESKGSFLLVLVYL